MTQSFVRGRLTWRLWLIAVVGLVLASAVLLVAPLRGATTSVEIISFSFQPQTVTIAVGDTVTWTNRDGATHTATGVTGQAFAFDTGFLGNDQSGSVRFAMPGRFEYYCMPHPGMRGFVVVEVAPFTQAVYLPSVSR